MFTWRIMVILENLSDSQQNISVTQWVLIHCQIFVIVKHIYWVGSFVYGYPHQKLQKTLWKQVASLLMIDFDPRLVMED